MPTVHYKSATNGHLAFDVKNNYGTASKSCALEAIQMLKSFRAKDHFIGSRIDRPSESLGLKNS